jgi:hypothetical protein
MEKNGNSGALPSKIEQHNTRINKTTTNLAFEKGVYGHPPSTVFDRPAPKFIEVDTLDPPTCRTQQRPRTRVCLRWRCRWNALPFLHA